MILITTYNDSSFKFNNHPYSKTYQLRPSAFDGKVSIVSINDFEDFLARDVKINEISVDGIVSNNITDLSNTIDGVLFSKPNSSGGGGSCDDATQIIINSEGTQILNNSIASGSVETNTIPDINHTDSDGSAVILPAQTPMVCTPNVAPQNATQTTEDSDGNVLYTDTIASGGSNTRIISDSTITNSDNSFNDVVLAEGNKTLPDVNHIDSDLNVVSLPAMEPMVCTPQIPPVDAISIIENSNGTQLYNDSIPSGVSNTRVISDSTISNSNGTFNDTVVAQGAKTLPDVTHVNTNGLDTILPAMIPMVCSPAADATQTTQDSAGNTLYTDTIASGGANTRIISDATNTFNGTAIAGVEAQGNKSITVLNDALPPVQVGTIDTDDKNNLSITVPKGASQQLFKTGQDISYSSNDDGQTQRGRGVDFFTLTENNSFGNTNRFTDTLGTQIYANDIVLDHSTLHDGNKVTSYKRTLEAPNRADLAHVGAPYTYEGFNDWYPTNFAEFFSICQIGIFTGSDQVDWLNYAPFNIPYQAIWAGSVGNRISRTMMFFATGFFSNNQQDLVPYILTRTHTIN